MISGSGIATPAGAKHVLIVGAGAAGLATASALRRRGHTGPITLVGDELDPPYDRPPLSKQFLKGEWDDARLALLPAERLTELGVTLRLGVAATGVDVGARTVALSDATSLTYDDLVIATGVGPRRLPGDTMPGVHVQRTLADTRALRSDLRTGARLVIVGAGFLGLEAAATARQLGAEVRVVEPQSAPLADRVGADIATRLLELHRTNGVHISTGVGVVGLGAGGPGGRVTAVELSDGSSAPCDLVLVAIGCVPTLGWLADSGITCESGVVCDEFCRAADGVWAAGDVLRWHHLRLAQHVRIEHRTNASDSADVVARNILGERIAYDPVPFFWTDQWGVKIQVAGTVLHDQDMHIVERSESGDAFIGLYHDGDVLLGVVGWNSPGKMARYRRDLGRASAPAAPATLVRR